MTSLLLALGCLAPSAGPTPIVIPPPPPTNPLAQPSPTPLWDHFTQHPGCPGLITQPFQMLPRICPVMPCPCDDHSNGGAHGATRPCPWIKEFHHAAHFPYPRFAPDGTLIPLDGLLIYEGMRLTVDPATGLYDVAFTATVPNMPVTVRMQLVFDAPLDPAKGLLPRQYRITLPPFRLEPKRGAKPGDASAFTFHVAHRGYSGLFRDTSLSLAIVQVPNLISPAGPGCCQPDFIDCRWAVSRVGTARFGSLTAVDDLNP